MPPTAKCTRQETREVKFLHKGCAGNDHVAGEVVCFDRHQDVEVSAGESFQLNHANDRFDIAMFVKPTECALFVQPIQIQRMNEFLTDFYSRCTLVHAMEKAAEYQRLASFK